MSCLFRSSHNEPGLTLAAGHWHLLLLSVSHKCVLPCAAFCQDLSQHLGNLRQLQQLSLKGNPLRQPYLKIMDAKGELALPGEACMFGVLYAMLYAHYHVNIVT